jgi:hypothetical protein
LKKDLLGTMKQIFGLPLALMVLEKKIFKD